MIRRAHVAIAIAVTVAALGGVARAQPPHFAPDEVIQGAVEAEPPTIELLTFGIGKVIFEKYGHAALCLIYHQPENPPVCFNYGVTDFAAGGALVWNFLRTQQKFWVEVDPRDGMIDFYKWEDRTIYSQILTSLTGEQRRAIEAALWTTTLPEHKYYFYDHFFNNCTTKLRDMLDAATGGKLRVGGDTPYPLTFRQLGYRGVAEFPVIPAMGDFYVGRQLDDTPSQWEAMFHPDMLREQVEAKLGAVPVLVYARHGAPFPTEASTGRCVTIPLVLLFGLPLVLARRWPRRWLRRTAMALATFELGLLGVTIWGIVILSSIAGLRWNENVFLFVPFDLALPWLGPAKRQLYARIRLAMVIAVSALAAIGVFHQPLWVPVLAAFLPFAALAFDPAPKARVEAVIDDTKVVAPITEAVEATAPVEAAEPAEPTTAAESLDEAAAPVATEP